MKLPQRIPVERLAVPLKLREAFGAGFRFGQDAATPLRIEVHQEDIDHSKRKSFTLCAFSNACARESGASLAFVTSNLTWLYDHKTGTATRYLNSKRLRDAIRAYDKRGPKHFPAGEFALGSVPPSQRIGVHRRKGPHTSKSKQRPYARTVLAGVRSLKPRKVVAAL